MGVSTNNYVMMARANMGV